MKIKDIESEYFGVTLFHWFTEEFSTGLDCVLDQVIRLFLRFCCIKKKGGLWTSQTKIKIVLHFLIVGAKADWLSLHYLRLFIWKKNMEIRMSVPQTGFHRLNPSHA